MADNKETPKSNIFQKALAATDSWLDAQISKGKSSIKTEAEDEYDFFYRKSVSKDQSYYIGSQGYQEKPHRLTFDHLKQMAYKDSVISAIIQTRQNQIANFSRCVHTKFEKGFRVVLKDEKMALEKVMDMVREGMSDEEILDVIKKKVETNDDTIDNVIKAFKAKKEKSEILRKAEAEMDPESSVEEEGDIPDDQEEAQEKKDLEFWRIRRRAKQLLDKATRPRRKAIQDFLINCGKSKDRPFESRKWNFNSLNRAIIRDSLQFDQFGIEVVPDNKGEPHHFVPVDGATIRFASPELGKYKSFPTQSNYDILYPEAELQALQEKDALELDPELLEAEKYKFVQVVRGKIERAFTDEELKLGMRNPTTDIYHNGYAISELELVVALVTSHLNTEYYNAAYFSQGFSAKGILHIKAPMNRRKLETIRQQWFHMLKGSRNSFQTPIFAGMDEVNWIPLTQNHSDIEFQGWLQYLIKMICGIYQIDPQEIGIGMKEEGSKGSGLSGDNTQEKIDLSKDKGLYPLLNFVENFYNVNIIDKLDDDFKMEFVGLKDESPKEALERQKKEAEFKKTVNEIREEDDLPPLPGMDTFIMSAVYQQWYQQYSPEAKKMQNEQQMNEMAAQVLTPEEPAAPEGEVPPEENPDQAEDHVARQLENSSPDNAQGEEVEKALKIEYYKLK